MKAGYSDNYAKGNVVKLLENVSVKSVIDERMAQLESEKIAKQEEVLQVFTSILRQELTEEVAEISPVTGEVVTYERKPTIAEVLKAGAELMKRYPTALELEKLRLEIEKLKSQIGGDEGQDEKIAEFISMLKGVVEDEE